MVREGGDSLEPFPGLWLSSRRRGCPARFRLRPKSRRTSGEGGRTSGEGEGRSPPPDSHNHPHSRYEVANISAVTPPIDDVLDRLHVVALPMRVRFRGITVREVALIDGPVGWGEFGACL